MPSPDLNIINNASLSGLAQPVQVIAVTGGKGGVGKTTVSVNLATSLAQSGKRVVLLDGDLGLANADVFLGLSPRYTLAHVMSGERTLDEILVTSPQGFLVVPAASGAADMVNMGEAEHLGIVQAFSTLAARVDVMIVDTAAGISHSVLQFAQASQHVVMVICDEPASLTDAYALVKVLSRNHGVSRFRVLTNQMRIPGSGAELFHRFERVTARFLDVVLEFAGEIPEDEYLKRSVREQRPVCEAYPASPAARAFKKLAARADTWPVPAGPRGNIEFFVERFGTTERAAPVGIRDMNAASAYGAHRGTSDADELIMQHAELVKRIAYHLAGRLPPSVEVDDLIQAGMLGLLEAASNYAANRGASFETYAGIRIRGAMIDALRKLDWAPRSVHRKARAVAAVVQQIERETGRDARDVEIAEKMGVPLDEYHSIVQDAASCRLAALDDMTVATAAGSEDPFRETSDDRFREALATAIDGLPERERLVMSLYYTDGLNLKEIGVVLKVTESRACQLHGQALVRLKARLADWRDGQAAKGRTGS